MRMFQSRWEKALPGHDVSSVRGMGWASITNGELLTLVEREAFEVFITGDKNMESQNRFAGRPFMTLLISTIHWPTVRQNVAAIAEALNKVAPGEVRLVDCGTFVAKRFR